MKSEKNLPEDGSPKPKKTPSLPKSQLQVGLLGVQVGQNLPVEFPDLELPNIDHAVLLQRSSDLVRDCQERDAIVSDKKLNSDAQTLLNKQIDKAVGVLKRVIKAANPLTNDFAAIYLSYGLSYDSNKYQLPNDSQQRRAGLQTLVAKLQERNNIPATILPAGFQLADWVQLQSSQAQLWNDSERLRRGHSRVATEIDDNYKLVYEDLKKVHQFLGVMYKGTELNRRRRQLGFLRESF